MTRAPIILKAMTIQKAAKRLEVLQKQWDKTLEKTNDGNISRQTYHGLWDKLDGINDEMTRLRLLFSLTNHQD